MSIKEIKKREKYGPGEIQTHTLLCENDNVTASLTIVTTVNLWIPFDLLIINNGDSMPEGFCGNSIPPRQISTSNVISLHFMSIATGSGRGFKLQYHSYSKAN